MCVCELIKSIILAVGGCQWGYVVFVVMLFVKFVC